MKKFIQNKLKDQKGLTLIELLAVIVIIAIIAAIAIPAIGNIIENSRYSAVKSDALNALSAANIYYAENPDKTSVTITQLTGAAGYLDDQGSLNNGDTISKVAATGALAISTEASKAIVYSGSKTVTFTTATAKAINDDKQKGSADGSRTITGP